MARDTLTTAQGGTCALIRTECCVHTPDHFHVSQARAGVNKLLKPLLALRVLAQIACLLPSSRVSEPSVLSCDLDAVAYPAAMGSGGSAPRRSRPRGHHGREACQEHMGHPGGAGVQSREQAGQLACANTPRTPLSITVLRLYGSCSPSIFPSSRICRKNMFSVQGQGLQGRPTGCTSLITKNARITGLELLGALALQGGEGLHRLARLVAKLSKLVA